MTRLTAIIIQTRGTDVQCEAIQDSKTKLWVGMINLYLEGAFDHHLITSEPFYPSSDEAVAEMKNIVAQDLGLGKTQEQPAIQGGA